MRIEKPARAPDQEFNLRAAAAAMARERTYRDFAELVNVSQTTRSAAVDLARSHAMLERAASAAMGDRTDPLTDEQPQDSDQAETAGMFFRMAVILYARATLDNSRSRRPLRIRESLDATDQARHKRIIDLRDKAIAHADRTDQLDDGPWETDTLLLHFWNEGILSIEGFGQRANYRQNMFEDMSLAIPASLTVIISKQNANDQALLAEIERLRSLGPEFETRLSAYAWEPRSFDLRTYQLPAQPRRPA